MAWSSTLAVSIDENAETILLTSPFFPRRSSNVVYIEGEAVEVTGSGGTVINVLRGMLGTDPVPHAQGAAVGRYDPIVVMNTTAGTAPGTAVAGPHVHVEYADAAHAHGTAAHLHDYAATGHAHGTAAHTHNYSDPAHNHDAAYSASGHAHGTVAHTHDYAATGHSHGTASHGHAQADVTNLTADLASKAGTAHNHDAAYSGTAHTHATYALTGHSHAGGGANVKSGVVNLGAGGSAVVTFTTPFQATPAVMVTSAFNSADTSTTLSVFPVSTTGFTIRGAGNAAGTVAWIATDAGNP